MRSTERFGCGPDQLPLTGSKLAGAVVISPPHFPRIHRGDAWRFSKVGSRFHATSHIHPGDSCRSVPPCRPFGQTAAVLAW